MRNAEVIRQWRILKTVEVSRHTSTSALAEGLGVTERTIRRDVEALQEAGFPLYDDRVDGKKVWRLVPGYRQKLTQSFSLAELAALYFGKNLLSFLGGAPFSADLESAFAKIKEALPPRSLPYLSRIQDLFAARPQPSKDYSRKKEEIAGLVEATLHQRQVRVAYHSFSSRRTKSYLLDPYRLVYHHGGLYLYARSHEHGEVRTFAVERIERIEVLESGFEVPKDFSVAEYARAAFGITGGEAVEVVLEVEPPVADYVRERVWHESQKVEEMPEGGVRLRLEVVPGFELKSWIKSYLPHIRVVAPASLRGEILAELTAAREKFLP
jgi:predicted DNA-binding transcriptional regulator YafY